MNFFKSTFFRCTALLLSLTVIFGGILALLNDLLYVSPEERTKRAIQKVYGQSVEFTTIFDIDNEEFNDDKLSDQEKVLIISEDGRINKIYQVGTDLLFQSTGYKGYKGGTITVWVQVSSQNDRLTIEKVLLENYDKQTLMSKLDSNYYGKFLVDVTDAYKNGLFFTTSGSGEFSNPVSGATYSANAGSNAVNCVLRYLGGIN